MADAFSFPGRPPSFRLGVSNAGLEDPASLDTSTSSKGGRGTASDRVMWTDDGCGYEQGKIYSVPTKMTMFGHWWADSLNPRSAKLSESRMSSFCSKVRTSTSSHTGYHANRNLISPANKGVLSNGHPSSSTSRGLPCTP